MTSRRINIDFKDGQGDVKDKQPELDDGYSLQGVLYYDINSAQSVHFTLGKKNKPANLKATLLIIVGRAG